MTSKGFLLNSNGFGNLLLIGIAASFTVFLTVNFKLTSFFNEDNKYSSLGPSAELVQTKLAAYLENQLVLDNLFQNRSLDNGTPINQRGQNLGIRCITAFRNGLPSQACNSQTIPNPITGPCATKDTIDEQKACWIEDRLENYRVDVLFPADPNARRVEDLILNYRTPNSGSTAQLSYCNEFDDPNALPFACPFRAQLYVWVECFSGLSQCGPGTDAQGIIKMAMVLRSSSSERPFGATKYSLVNLRTMGTL